MLDRIPDQALLADTGGCATERIQATRGKDYAFIYSACGRPIIVRPDKIAGRRLNAAWFDPRTGQTTFIRSFDNEGQQTFSPPLPAASPMPSQREDWILILDDAARDYFPPVIHKYAL